MNWIKHIFILTVDLIGLLIIGSIILFALNYFKILPFSQTFPKYFGFLPQAVQEKVVVTPTPAPASSQVIWEKQANSTLISNYSDYFKKNNMPATVYEETADTFLEKGAFTAYNKSHIQTVTSEGTTIFQINNGSVFRKISPPITSKNQGGDGTDRVTAEYKSSADFFSDVPFGSYLQIIYTLNGNLKSASSVDYYPEYKF